jgi:hypothetical protein
MPRPRRNYGNHFVTWSPENNAVEVSPQYRNSSATIEFGLGNATMVLNLSNLPTEGIVLPITGETTGQGILPTSPFGLKRWYAMPENMNIIPPLTITGFDEWTMDIQYPQANGGSVKQVASVPIIQNGYGGEIIHGSNRVNW